MNTVTYRIKTLHYPRLSPIFILENRVNGAEWEWLISTQDGAWLQIWLKEIKIKVNREQSLTVEEE